MPRKSRAQLVAERRNASDPSKGTRFVGIQLDVYVQDEHGKRVEDEPPFRYGGMWDRRERRYIGDAPASIEVELHPGQLEAWEIFDEWLAAHIAGDEVPMPERIYSLILSGGQRSGKSLAAILMAIVYAIAVPQAKVWIVCPTSTDFEEVDDVITDVLPPKLYRVLGAPKYRYTLANGSRIVERSAYNPKRSLKVGDADFIVQNEAQEQEKGAFAVLRARIAKVSGLLVQAMNPPSKPIGMWAADHVIETKAGTRQARAVHIDPFDNPHIDHGPLLAMKAELDERTFDEEVRGLFLGARDAVLYNWRRDVNERRPPDIGEITRDFLEWKEGRPYARAVVIDVQQYPHMVGVEFRQWENPLTRGAADPLDRFRWCHNYLTDEIALSGADEDDFARAMLDRGWQPEETLLIVDASGAYQFSYRDAKTVNELRKRTGGRGSFDIFNQWGFRYIVKPDDELEKNPDILERCRATTSKIGVMSPGPYGAAFLFADPTKRELCKSIREWPLKHGRPSRDTRHAHRGDVVTYGMHRLHPRRKPSPFDVEVVQRSERRDQMGVLVGGRRQKRRRGYGTGIVDG